MKRVSKVTSPKKTDVLDVSQRMFLAVEYASKNHVEDHKHWQEELTRLNDLIKKMGAGINSEQNVNKTELGKQYTEAGKILTKLDKEIEKARNQLHKEQLDFEKNLLTPSTNGSFNILDAEQKSAVTANMNKISQLLTESRKKLEPVINLAGEYSRKLTELESPVNKLILSEQIDETIKLNERLNERLELILQCTSMLGNTTSTAANTNTSATSILASTASSSDTVSNNSTSTTNSTNNSNTANSNGVYSNGTSANTEYPKQFSLPETEVKLLTLFNAHVKGQEKLNKAKQQVHETAELLAKLSIGTQTSK